MRIVCFVNNYRSILLTIYFIQGTYTEVANFIVAVNRALIRNKQRVYLKSLIEVSFRGTFPSSRTAVISLKSFPFSTNLTFT